MTATPVTIRRLDSCACACIWIISSRRRLRWVDLEDSHPFGDAKSPFHGLSDHIPLIGNFDLQP